MENIWQCMPRFVVGCIDYAWLDLTWGWFVYCGVWFHCCALLCCCCMTSSSHCGWSIAWVRSLGLLLISLAWFLLRLLPMDSLLCMIADLEYQSCCFEVAIAEQNSGSQSTILNMTVLISAPGSGATDCLLCRVVAICDCVIFDAALVPHSVDNFVWLCTHRCFNHFVW